MNIYIIDDDQQLQRSLSTLFQLNQFKVYTFSSAEEFLDNVEPKLEVGCIILDLRMEKMSGLELQSHIATTLSYWPIIFLSGHGKIHTAVTAIKNGAYQFLEKPVDNHTLLNCATQAIKQSKRLVAIAQQKSQLTVRELQIAERIMQGLTSKEIARELELSIKTVEYHRANINRKTDLKALRQKIMLLREH